MPKSSTAIIYLAQQQKPFPSQQLAIGAHRGSSKCHNTALAPLHDTTQLNSRACVRATPAAGQMYASASLDQANQGRGAGQAYASVSLDPANQGLPELPRQHSHAQLEFTHDQSNPTRAPNNTALVRFDQPSSLASLHDLCCSAHSLPTQQALHNLPRDVQLLPI